MGVFWYHPHPHTEAQVLDGLSGMLVIEASSRPIIRSSPPSKRRTLIFKDFELPGAEDDDDIPKTKTINGFLGGTISTAPGSIELWELGNIGADAYRLTLWTAANSG